MKTLIFPRRTSIILAASAALLLSACSGSDELASANAALQRKTGEAQVLQTQLQTAQAETKRLQGEVTTLSTKVARLEADNKAEMSAKLRERQAKAGARAQLATTKQQLVGAQQTARAAVDQASRVAQKPAASKSKG